MSEGSIALALWAFDAGPAQALRAQAIRQRRSLTPGELLLPHSLIREFPSTCCPLSSGQRQRTTLMPPFPLAPSQLIAQQLGVASMSPPCHRCAKGAADNDNQNQDPSRQRSHGRQHLARTYADPVARRK